jgi:bifunctional non-homologous end joining protein LigD
MAKRGLDDYRAKRNFSKTAEPSGAARVESSPHLRFVIQKHAARQLHYDLRLEFNGVFKSWAVARGPSIDPADKRLAVEVEDHPLDYGDFEGNIPKGEYGGGTVLLWDRGYWSPEGAAAPEQAFESGDLKFTLEGRRLTGSWVLVRMRGDRYGGKRTNWLLIKHRDASAVAGGTEALLAEDSSVASGRTLQQIAQGIGRGPKPFMMAGKGAGRADAVWTGHAATADAPAPSQKAPAKVHKPVRVKVLPNFVEPQLCKLVEHPPSQEGWGHEVKLDGYRAELRVQGKSVKILTRTGLDWSDRFAAIAEAAEALPDCLLDGEVVALDDHGLPNFGALQAALSEQRSDALYYFVFDLLFEDREDLRPLPLAERKRRLQQLLAGLKDGSRFHYVAHLVSNGHDIFASAKKMHLEGIVSKRLDAPYRSGRSGSWTKAKVRAGQEIVVGGWTSAGGSVRSLLAGVYRGGTLEYVGRVGTGYALDVAKKISPRLRQLVRDKSPFGGANPPPKDRTIQWLKPSLVAEIEFAGWTDSGMIRQAAFKGLREDKNPQDVVAELPTRESEVAMPVNKQVAASKGGAAVLGVSISSPDKILWPKLGRAAAVTKLDLAKYFESIGAWMMPHLQGRPCSLVRVPDGLGGEQFFQRHASSGLSKFLTAVKVKGDKAPYVQIDHIEGLIAVAQIGTLEVHPWNCAEGNPEVAGRLVFDLDPAPDVAFDAVIAGAIEIRDRLQVLGLESFCKTTGGKGLHVVTPLASGRQAVQWPVAKNFAHIVCAQMAGDSPGKYLDNMSKSQRSGRIFLDYLRNDKTATAVAVLSPRARAGAPVSMPLDWKAVRGGLDPPAFTIRTAPQALAKTTPWLDYAAGARSLAAAIKAVTAKPKAAKHKAAKRKSD